MMRLRPGLAHLRWTVSGRRPHGEPPLLTEVGPAARFLLDHHLGAGDFCVLLSSSPKELVELVGRELGMHRSIGTRAAVEDGRYTGDLDRPLCYGGELEALRLALGDIDLRGATA
jgi:phosphoserine phosphatase